MATSRRHCVVLHTLLMACSLVLQQPLAAAQPRSHPSFLWRRSMPSNMAGDTKRTPRVGGIIKDKFSIQIMSYNRPHHALRAILHHMQAPSLHKITLVWNDDEHGRSFYLSGAQRPSVGRLRCGLLRGGGARPSKYPIRCLIGCPCPSTSHQMSPVNAPSVPAKENPGSFSRQTQLHVTPCFPCAPTQAWLRCWKSTPFHRPWRSSSPGTFLCVPVHE